MGTTSIQWTERVWNPTTGCDKVSPGCKFCYAETIAERFWATQYPPVEFSVHDPTISAAVTDLRARRFTDVQTHENRLLEPLTWRKPARIFVNSMSDLFHEDVPDAFIDRVFAVMALCPQHTFQVLTKRPERMRDYLSSRPVVSCIAVKDLQRLFGGVRGLHDTPHWQMPLPNVWLLVSCEDQPRADERIPLLLQTPAAVRGVSLEPLLGPIDLDGGVYDGPGWLRGWHTVPEHARGCDGSCSGGRCPEPVQTENERLDWIIIGCESGAHPRNHEQYEQQARAILRQCADAGVAAFHKQMPIRGRVSGDPSEWATDLRVRQYPTGGA